MNVRAECRNQQCSQYGIGKSVVVGQMWGYGAENGRVKCPSCGRLMTTTKSVKTSAKPYGKYLRRKSSSKRMPKG
jgi:hypothetical protein